MEIIIIAVLNLIVYAKTLQLGYVSDDILALPMKFKSRRERIYHCLVSIPTGNKRIDHGISTIVHTAVCVLIYLALGSNNISFVAALLFSFNPSNNQASIWISGRTYAWCALFLLLAILIPILAFPALICATVNPSGFFAPMGIVGSKNAYLALLLPLVWLVRYKRLVSEVKTRRTAEVVTFDKKLSFEKVIIAIKIYGYYFALCLIPFKLTWYDSFMQSGSGAGNSIERKKALKLDWTFFLGLALIGYLIYSITNWTPMSWGIFWYSVCIAPYLNLFRMQQEIASRYVYIPNIGVMFALAHILPPLAVPFVVGAYLARLLAFYPRAYKDDYWLVEASVLEDSQAWFCWFTRGHKRWSQGSHREALNMWVMAKMISPEEFKVLFNISVVLKILGKNAESEAYLKLAEANIIKGQEKTAGELVKELRNAKNAGEYPLLR